MAEENIDLVRLYPTSPEVLEGVVARFAMELTSLGAYRHIIETTCGVMDDSQDVELYDAVRPRTEAGVKSCMLILA